MSFESCVIAFSERFVSGHTFQFVVAPALADLEFDPGRTPLTRFANRLAVIRAVAGGLGHELKRDSGIFLGLTLVPTCYYLCLMTLCLDAVSTWTQALAVAGFIAMLSLLPVMVCFWPSRQPMRDSD
jgi:hypothetical protein